MSKLNLFQKIFLISLITLAISTLFSFAYYFTVFKGRFYEEVEALLKNQIHSIELYLEQQKIINPVTIEYFQKLALKSENRITVIYGDGRVFFDSSQHSVNMDNHINRPEVLGAKTHQWGSSKRFSQTLGKYFLYVAKGVDIEERSYFVRVARSMDVINKDLRGALWKMSLVSFCLLFLSSALLYFLIRIPMQRIERLTSAAKDLARGQYSVRIEKGKGSDEVEQLTQAVNDLAVSLEAQGISLQDSEKKFFEVLNFLKDGFVLLGNDGNLEFCNKAWKRVFGISDKQEPEAVSSMVRSVHILKLIEEANAEKKLVQSVVDLEIKSAREPFLIQVFPVELEQGPLTAVTLSNLSAIRRAEDLKRDFVANASHQLKTPLAAISGYAEMLRDMKNLSDDKKKDYLEKILHRVSMANNMIVRLMKLTKAEELNKDVIFERVGVKECMDQMIQNHETLIDKKKLQVRINHQDSTLSIETSREFLEMATNALFENALFYSHEGGNVDIEIWQQETKLQIDIRDYGMGMKEEDRNRVFERFYRSGKAQEFNALGTGIGLPLAKQCAAILDGDILVDSAFGKGSTFSLILPIQARKNQRKEFTDFDVEDS